MSWREDRQPAPLAHSFPVPLFSWAWCHPVGRGVALSLVCPKWEGERLEVWELPPSPACHTFPVLPTKRCSGLGSRDQWRSSCSGSSSNSIIIKGPCMKVAALVMGVQNFFSRGPSRLSAPLGVLQ